MRIGDFARCVGVACIAALASAVLVRSADTEVDFKGQLYRSLFSATSGEFRVVDLDRSARGALSPAMRKRLAQYEARGRAFNSLLRPPADLTFPADCLFTARQAIEKSIVALIDSPGIEKTAAHFAQQVNIYYEWEGMPDGPLDEARRAAKYLVAEPATSLRPYLVLFLLHRYRCAHECFVWGKKDAGAKDAANEYCTLLQLARADTDPLVRLIAEDLDKQRTVYLADYINDGRPSACFGSPVRPY
jgi:hypothetical protein